MKHQENGSQKLFGNAFTWGTSSSNTSCKNKLIKKNPNMMSKTLKPFVR